MLSGTIGGDARTGASRKRALTDDRRRQNREAQRRYRERRKAVLDNAQEPVSPMWLESFNHNQSYTAPSQSNDRTDFELSSENDPPAGMFVLDDLSPLETSITQQRTENLGQVSSVFPSLPSPYGNYLHIQKLSFYAARIQNGLYLGLPLFLAQKEDDISPWYWHNQFAALVSEDTESQNTCTPDSASSSYRFYVQRPVRRKPCFQLAETLQPDLTPTALQRSRPHGMYLDVIPFPVFRDRAITLLSMDPPAFSEIELKRDIEAEGLLVWGVGQGSINHVASLVRDKRNWECSRWFYQKWRLLIDGSGLEEQSKWWRMMRGEEDEGLTNSDAFGQ